MKEFKVEVSELILITINLKSKPLLITKTPSVQ